MLPLSFRQGNSHVTYLVVVDTRLVLRQTDDDCLLLLFSEEPGFGRGIRQGKEDDEAGEDGDGSVDDEDVLTSN